MAATNFGLLTDEQKTVWSRDLWKQARNHSFINKFTGTGPDAMIQRITELTKTERGTRAVITLVADLEGDGVAGDRTLEGSEEALKAFDQVIEIDQLRHANRSAGRMAEQATVVRFRQTSKDVLAYWLADRIDQLAFLTLAGLDYSVKNSGGQRIGSDFLNLAFNAPKAPTPKRALRWNAATGEIEEGGASSDIQPADKITWKSLVQAKGYAGDNHIRPISEKGGVKSYHVFLSPTAMVNLKLDPDYMANLRNAQVRSNSNPLFTGTSVHVDGLWLHEFEHVPNTRLAPNGQKWGGSGDVNGCQVLICGAQALGLADIGAPEWVEKTFDYDNQPGISVGKIFGLLKPQFPTMYSGGTLEDHGVLSMYVAQ